MARVLTVAGASLLAVVLAGPAQAAQAVARSRGGDSTPSSSGSSGSGSSSSGDQSSGGSSHEPPVARRAPSVSQPRSGSAQPRGGATAGSGGSAGQRSGSQATPGAAGDTRYAQGRSGRLATSRGQAMPRPATVPLRPNRVPVYVGRYYSPWYFGGSLYSSRYYGYNPFGWRYSPYGYYGLFGYVPYGAYYYADPWDPFMYGGGGSYERDRRDESPRVGSLRLRVSPKHGKVYIDGALVGTVDDFDGLRDHLEIAPGRHELEIRAEGYESYRTEVVVSEGRTVTERGTLKKK